MIRLFLCLFALAATPAFAERIQAETECAPAGGELEFACIFTLTRAGAPVEGAVFSVRAEMPTMPMAHNMRPIAAEPAAEAGTYTATLPLEMHGRWALRLEFSEPERDLIVLHEEFVPGSGE